MFCEPGDEIAKENFAEENTNLVSAGEKPMQGVRADGDDYVLLEFGPAIIDLRLRFIVHSWMLAVKEQMQNFVIDVTPGIRFFANTLRHSKNSSG